MWFSNSEFSERVSTQNSQFPIVFARVSNVHSSGNIPFNIVSGRTANGGQSISMIHLVALSLVPISEAQTSTLCLFGTTYVSETCHTISISVSSPLRARHHEFIRIRTRCQIRNHFRSRGIEIRSPPKCIPLCVRTACLVALQAKHVTFKWTGLTTKIAMLYQISIPMVSIKKKCLSIITLYFYQPRQVYN